ncbi:MAG: hypothetical protein VX923_06425 [Pseudomonadota bacterium]|nr:hypothetical protein [Pseudomonadota bacterium]
MQNIEQKLNFFFKQVAKKDESLLKHLKKNFNLTDKCWHFTLPNLHLFLQNQDDVFKKIDYKKFRKLIFNSHINKTVKLYGAEVTIKENKAKVDASSYNLTWRKN